MKTIGKIVTIALMSVGFSHLFESYKEKKSARTPGTSEWDRLHPAAGFEKP